MTFWLHRFRKLDVTKQSHRKMLIDTFINAIYLYDDKMLITFNYKDRTKKITFSEIPAPSKQGCFFCIPVLMWAYNMRESDPRGHERGKKLLWSLWQRVIRCRTV